jgi:hypothetical protein
MLTVSTTKNEYVIEIYHAEYPEEGFESLIHKAHERARRIRKPKGHHKPLLQAFFGFKHHFPFVTFTDPDLVVPTSKIDLGEDR